MEIILVFLVLFLGCIIIDQIWLSDIHLIHDWGKWSEIKVELWVTQTVYLGRVIGVPREFKKQCQTRYCKKCGAYQRKEIIK